MALFGLFEPIARFFKTERTKTQVCPSLKLALNKRQRKKRIMHALVVRIISLC